MVRGGRKGGIASGVKRRRLARRRRGIPRGVDRDLPLAYELRRISRREFDARYGALWPYPERPTAVVSWAKGRETVWQHLLAWYAHLCVRGQYCRSTNDQRVQALAVRGLGRSRRTVQRCNRKLEAMRIARVSPWSRHDPETGWTGYTVLQWQVTRRVRDVACHPPSGNGDTPLRSSGGSPPLTSKPGIPPPAAADAEPPDKPAERQSSEVEVIAAQIEFQRAKMALGSPWAERAELRLRQLELELGHARARMVSTADRGLRCST